MTRQYDSWNIAPPADGIFEDPEGPCIIWVTFCDICVCDTFLASWQPLDYP